MLPKRLAREFLRKYAKIKGREAMLKLIAEAKASAEAERENVQNVGNGEGI